MTKDELRITLANPCWDNYDLRDALTDLLRDLYARLIATEARVAALESPALSDTATDDSAAMDGWRAVAGEPLSVRQAYLVGFDNGVKHARGRK